MVGASGRDCEVERPARSLELNTICYRGWNDLHVKVVKRKVAVAEGGSFLLPWRANSRFRQ